VMEMCCRFAQLIFVVMEMCCRFAQLIFGVMKMCAAAYGYKPDSCLVVCMQPKQIYLALFL
jgi:hypothetical protein